MLKKRFIIAAMMVFLSTFFLVDLSANQTNQEMLFTCPHPGKWVISVWLGQDNTDTGQALATCEQEIDFAYHLDPETQNWLRYFTDIPEISNLLTLNNMQGIITHGTEEPVPTPTPAPISTPTPQVDTDFLGLQESIRTEGEKAWFDIAVSVYDIQTDQMINVRGDEPRLPACTMNFFVLLSVVIDLQNGLYPETDVGELISQTIYGSNPDTAHDLLIKTGEGDVFRGIDKINALLASLGLQTGPNPALFDHPPGYGDTESRFGKINNSITANQANQTLVKIYNGEILSAEWRDYFLEKLTGVKPGLNHLIAAGAIGGITSHKNGFMWDASGWVDNDIGIVTFERNGKQFAYVMSLYMEKIPTRLADVPIGQKISRMVWEYFSNKYQ